VIYAHGHTTANSNKARASNSNSYQALLLQHTSHKALTRLVELASLLLLPETMLYLWREKYFDNLKRVGVSDRRTDGQTDRQNSR